MSKIAGNIREGAMAFLSEYKQLAIFVLIVAGLLAFANSGKADSNADRTVLCRRCNFSGLAGYVGMRVATDAMFERRTPREGSSALVAFSGGAYGDVSSAWRPWLGALFLLFKDEPVG